MSSLTVNRPRIVPQARPLTHTPRPRPHQKAGSAPARLLDLDLRHAAGPCRAEQPQGLLSQGGKPAADRGSQRHQHTASYPAWLHRRRTDRPVPATSDRRLSTPLAGMSRSPVRLRAVTPAHLTSSAARPAAHPSGPGPRFPSISYQDPLRSRQRRRPVPLRSPRQRYRSWRTARPATLPSRTHSSPDRSDRKTRTGRDHRRLDHIDYRGHRHRGNIPNSSQRVLSYARSPLASHRYLRLRAQRSETTLEPRPLDPSGRPESLRLSILASDPPTYQY